MRPDEGFASWDPLDCRKWLRRGPEHMEAATRGDESVARWRGWEGRFAEVGDGLATGIKKRKVLRMILRCLTPFTVTGDIRRTKFGGKIMNSFLEI